MTSEVDDNWNLQGKIWDSNPFLVSHVDQVEEHVFTQVFESSIGTFIQNQSSSIWWRMSYVGKPDSKYSDYAFYDARRRNLEYLLPN